MENPGYLELNFIHDLIEATKKGKVIWKAFKEDECCFGYYKNREFLICKYEFVNGGYGVTFNETRDLVFLGDENICDEEHELFNPLDWLFKLAKLNQKTIQKAA